MRDRPNESRENGLPPCAAEFVAQVIRKMRYRRKVRRDVQAELTSHFDDELRDCENPQEREQTARALIEEFGDAALLGVLCRRAKKRCRPLWWKVLVRSALVLGVLWLYLFACFLPLRIGKPTIRVNYIEWLNNRWRPAQPGAENARQYYDQAVSLYVEPPEALEARRETPEWTIQDCNAADLQLLATWLAENEPAFDLLRKGANTPDYWPFYDISEAVQSEMQPFLMEANVLGQATKSLAGYGPLARALKDWVTYRTRLGEVEEAIADSLVLLRFGRHLEGKGLIFEQLLGMASDGFGCKAVFDVLQKPDVSISIEVLRHVQEELTSIFDDDQPVINLDGEKALWYDNIQRGFTDDGCGGGRAVGGGFVLAAGDWRGNLARMLLFHYPDRREAVAEADYYFERARGVLYTPPNKGALSPGFAAGGGGPRLNLFLAMAEEAHGRLAIQAWRIKTGEVALLTTVAILRYKAEKGSYPDALEQLVGAGVLAKLPDDPFGRGPLAYNKTAEGFRLYSWGGNLADDGGRQGVGQDGQPRMWADNGDTVFWPVGQY